MKTIGLLLIFFCFCMGGYFASDKQRRILQTTKSFLDFLYFIKLNISTRACPLSQIYPRFKSGELERLRFYEYLSDESLKNPLYTFLVQSDARLYTGECFELLLEFSQSIGKSSSVFGEEKLCERFIAEYEAKMEKQNQKCAQLVPLYSRLGVIFGLFVCAVLL